MQRNFLQKDWQGFSGALIKGINFTKTYLTLLKKDWEKQAIDPQSQIWFSSQQLKQKERVSILLLLLLLYGNY